MGGVAGDRIYCRAVIIQLDSDENVIDDYTVTHNTLESDEDISLSQELGSE